MTELLAKQAKTDESKFVMAIRDLTFYLPAGAIKKVEVSRELYRRLLAKLMHQADNLNDCIPPIEPMFIRGVEIVPEEQPYLCS